MIRDESLDVYGLVEVVLDGVGVRQFQLLAGVVDQDPFHGSALGGDSVSGHGVKSVVIALMAYAEDGTGSEFGVSIILYNKEV